MFTFICYKDQSLDVRLSNMYLISICYFQKGIASRDKFIMPDIGNWHVESVGMSPFIIVHSPLNSFGYWTLNKYYYYYYYYNRVESHIPRRLSNADTR